MEKSMKQTTSSKLSLFFEPMFFYFGNFFMRTFYGKPLIIYIQFIYFFTITPNGPPLLSHSLHFIMSPWLGSDVLDETRTLLFLYCLIWNSFFF